MRTDHVFSCVREDAKGKETEVTTKEVVGLLRMSMTISRNSTGVNGLKDLLNEPLMQQELHVPGYGKRKLTLL